jgi:hypothetical protein
MYRLAELQHRIARAITDDTGQTIADLVRANGIDPRRRIRIYRNNMFANYTDALRQTYATVLRIVGEQFFDFAAQNYVRAHGSRSGNLHDFGDQFAGFLEKFEPSAGLPYLGDVARIDWLCERAYFAREYAGIASQALQRVPEYQRLSVTFDRHPGTGLLESDFPVFRIWRVNQTGYEGDQTVRLDEGGTRVMVRSTDTGAEVVQLNAGEYLFLQQLLEGKTLYVACQAAMQRQPNFQPDIMLQALIDERVLINVHIPAHNT